MQMAEGYPMEKDTADRIEKDKEKIKQWPYSKKVMLPHLGENHEGPLPGEVFRQPDLLETLKKLVSAEQEALAKGKSRKEALSVRSGEARAISAMTTESPGDFPCGSSS